MNDGEQRHGQRDERNYQVPISDTEIYREKRNRHQHRTGTFGIGKADLRVQNGHIGHQGCTGPRP